MWNHIPKMLGQMRETGRPPVTLSHEEMSNLFALMFFVRQLDEPGNPELGREILRAKGCTECHQTRVTGEGIGPDLTRWGRYANPIVWAQLMWEHAPVMEETMKRSGIAWPKLEGADLVHIVAYVRSIGASGEKMYLSPGSVIRGATLFQEKACGKCHPGSGPDLAATDLPVSVGALASRMWNHSPLMIRTMQERDVSRPPLAPQELADIVAYVLALGHIDRGGNPELGVKVFREKGCAQCHEQDRKSGAPRLTGSEPGSDATPVYMATAMWNHGETMLQRMTEAGLSWPVFNDHEMVDLLAYLNASRSSAPSAGSGGR
jgi:cytochrome c551/c552